MIDSRKYFLCINCKASGIWKGEFHSSICSTCDGLGLINHDGTSVDFPCAVKLLKMRHIQLRSEFYSIQKLAPEPAKADFEFSVENPLNRDYTHDKTNPLHWEPKGYAVCSECNGSGLYVGIVSTVNCGSCYTSGIVGVDCLELEPHEQIAILAMRNKVLKRRIKILILQPGVNDAIRKFKDQQLYDDMR